MNQLAEIVVQKVWPLAAGKKWTNITTANGEKYWGPPNVVNQFVEGESCKVEWEPSGKDGSLKTIVRKVAGVPPNAMPKQNVRQRMDPADAKGAFVTKILEAYIRAGKVSLNRDAISLARQEIAAGYDMSHNPQRADDLNDEIGF